MTLAAPITLSDFNQLPAAEAIALLHDICHCRDWAEQMVAARPYDNLAALLHSAEQCWRGDEAQLLEAVQGHAKIGDKKAIAAGGKTAREQGQVASAQSSTLQALAQLNGEYEQKFGFIYLVCASGKSPETLLELLTARLINTRAQELKNAAAEQAAITRLRLQRLFA